MSDDKTRPAAANDRQPKPQDEKPKGEKPKDEPGASVDEQIDDSFPASELQRTIIEQAKRELDSAGIETLQPQQVTRIIPPDSDPSRLLSSAQPTVE